MKEDYEASYIIDHIPRNTPYNRRPGLPLDPEYITVHSTGNPGSTARNERAWHAGDGNSGPGNRRSFAVEICESGDRGKTLEKAAFLLAGLLRERGWGTDRLRRHYDWSGKSCPSIFMADSWAPWESFKRQIQKQLTSSSPPEPPAVKPATGQTDKTAITKPPASKPETPAAPGPPAGNPGNSGDLPKIQSRVEGTLDGRPADFEAYLINNSTYVPLRPLAAALGLQLKWQEGRYHIMSR